VYDGVLPLLACLLACLLAVASCQSGSGKSIHANEEPPFGQGRGVSIDVCRTAQREEEYLLAETEERWDLSPHATCNNNKHKKRETI